MADLSQAILNFTSTAIVALMAGGISFLAGKGMKKQEWQLAMRREKIALRQRLYAELLTEVERLHLLSMDEKISNPTGFNGIIGQWAEVELVASGDVRTAGKKLVGRILDAHAIEEKSGEEIYPLKVAFIEAARQDFASYEA